MTIILTSGVEKRRLAMSIPGAYWDDTQRAWVVDPATLSDNGRALVARHFPEVKLPESNSGDVDVRPLDLATAWAEGVGAESLLPNLPADMRESLYRYQQVDLGYLCARIRRDGGAYCGWSRGLGKTFGAIAAAIELGADKWVVVCPNSSKEAGGFLRAGR